jgi:hypothetical protein
MDNGLFDCSPIVERPAIQWRVAGASPSTWANIEHFQVDRCSTSINDATAG